MKTFNKSLAAVAVAATLGLAMPAIAGNNDGSVAGIVQDSQSRPIANATLTLKNEQTGFTRVVSVDNDGRYRIGQLPVGKYSVTVNKEGFETFRLDNVRVSIGQTAQLTVPLQEVGVERIAVTGSQISAVDVSSAETALNIDAVELSRIPVPRSVTSVALLAPGTTRGDSRFGGASFGGSSVAENQIYINGLNVTNFRNGLGFSNVPYEFYDQFQVKTGGYSAEFGRSTGGVINAVTKSGTNEFKFGGSVYVQPGNMRETSPSVMANDGSFQTYRDDDERSQWVGNVYASGPIIKDKLFFYGIYAPENVQQEDNRFPSEGDMTKSERDDAFWGAKLDWNITDSHRMELLAFSDESEFVTDTFTEDENGRPVYASTTYDNSGGKNWSLKYTGHITDDFTLSALYGKNEYDLTTNSNIQNDCELIGDYRIFYGAASDVPINGLWVGCATTSDYFVEDGKDEREAFRVDAEWMIADNHLLRFGFDQEVNTSMSNQRYSGPNGAYWLVFPAFAGETVNGVVMENDVDYIRDRVRTVGGNFETEARAFYIEDHWNVTDTVTAIIGLRNEQFDNKNGEGNTFAKIDNMWAPRIGVSWDINADGESKLFANVGRYFLPVANNTNVRLAGNESDTRDYYVLEGWTQANYNGTPYYIPQLGDKIGNTRVNADGSVPDTRSIVADGLDPMYQDEFIVGYQAAIDESWSYGVKFTHRQMNGAIDDMIIDHAIAAKFGCDGYHPHQYVLGNPGKDMRVFTDTDCDKAVDDWVTLSAEELQYPEAMRKYIAADLNLRRQWDGEWSIDATYTWSHSYGNSEGLVKSDNGQTDAGLTTDFDFPELMDGAYGNLPNDRRHMLKVYGVHAITDQLTLGYNINIESGRPLNAFGLGHPNVGEVDYGSTYYLATNTAPEGEDAVYEYTRVPRGSQGRLPWQSRVDLNLSYSTKIMEADTTFKVEVFNVFNADKHTRVDETAETTLGNRDTRSYGVPLAFQTPRYVQLSAKFDF